MAGRSGRWYAIAGTLMTFPVIVTETSRASGGGPTVPNVALRQAMADVRMTEHALARRVGVDEKTISRWVAQDGRVPHPRHRWAACEALGVDEAVLWPEAIRAAVKTGPDREIAAVYPYRAACPASLWRRLITSATTEMTFAGYTSYFLWIEQPNLGAALRRKAGAGCKVRFLVGDPDSEVTRQREQVEATPLTISTRIAVTLEQLERLRDVDGIEARFSDRHIALSVFAFDSNMIVTPHLANLAGHESPALHLRRCQDDGIFDRFTMHVGALWDQGRDIWGASPASAL
jgi:transcriptional regulator with XRE-family HTH domain